MRKRFLLFPIMLALVAAAVTGCDFMRRAAGRPDSAEIEAKSLRISEYEDSLKRVAAADSIEKARADSLEAAKLSRPADSYKYYIVIGSFSDAENADRHAAKMTEKGLGGITLRFRGGMSGVGICGTDDPAEAETRMKELKRQGLCPEAAWILERKNR